MLKFPARIAQIALRGTAIAVGLFCTVAGVGTVAGAEDTMAAKLQRGAAVYAAQCVDCHGELGRGTADYPSPLLGDRSVGDLTELITNTMPDGAPETCTGTEAAAVAAYIHEAFYSELAQARHAPARIELSRLTVRQYQNCIFDLVGSFQSRVDWPQERGLKGTYFRKHVVSSQGRVFDRIDPQVDFDYGDKSPEPGKIEAKEFAMEWEGAVIAPETGDYEFVIETPNGMRFWINNLDVPAIDAAVQSGSDTRHAVTVRLLGGRAYAIKLHCFKSSRDKTAFCKLRWQPPQLVEQTIPNRLLLPRIMPRRLVVETPFPPDDRSTGYERGNNVSRAWDEATTYAALEVGTKVNERLAELANVQPSNADADRKLREFLTQFATRAFRRPLTEEERRFFVDDQFDAAGGNPDLALKRSILLTLKSPRFLYREATLPPDQAVYATASRLSFALWDSLPDEPLLRAAEQGELRSREQIRQHAERMVHDPRSRAKLQEFFRGWLQFERFADLEKDASRYPEFDARIASDLRTSLELFLEDVAWGDRPDFRRLLQSDELFLNSRLAGFYGIETARGEEFRQLPVPSQQRAGVLTHPYLLAGFAYAAESSPIHRGVFVSRSLLGRSLKPPPEAVSPSAPDLHPGLSTRERVQLQTSPPVCQSCHAMINPLGFPLERFDAVGRLRAVERDKPVDARGSYRTLSDEQVQFTGPQELAGFLATSPETHEAFVEQLFHYCVKQPVRAYGETALPDLHQRFSAGGFNLRTLLIEIATTAAARDESGSRRHD